MYCKVLVYTVLFFIYVPFHVLCAQGISSEISEANNTYFTDSIMIDYDEDDGAIKNPEAVFTKYYKGLDLLNSVDDSIKFKFYGEYGLIMAASKLYNESNKLAQKGAQLAIESPDQLNKTEAGSFYNQMALNYLELQKYDSVTWAYKTIIEINKKTNNIRQNVSGYNNLGYHYYLNIKNNDSALYYLNKLQQNPELEAAYSGSFTLKWSIKDNIALVYMDQGRIAEASILFKEIYEHYGQSRKGYLWRERWLRGGLQHVDAEISLGNLSKANRLLREVDSDFTSIQNFPSAPLEYFPSKLLLLKTKQKYARATGKFKESDRFGEMYLNLKDSLNIINNKKQMKDQNLIRKIGLYNARRAIEKEKSLGIIEKEKLALDLNQKSVKVYWSISIATLLAIMVLGYLYFRRARKFNENKNKMQAEYSQSLIKTQEDERLRVARELHDSVGQKLMLLSKTTKKIGDLDAEKLASSALNEVRDISRGLHPSNLERLGLTMAINALIYDINSNTDLFFSDEIDNIDSLLSKDSELHLYRIIQEALNNILKHSEAKAIKIKVQNNEGSINIIIDDNGKGFNTESTKNKMGLGMKTLFERAKIIGGHLSIKSDINKGTSLFLNIPI